MSEIKPPKVFISYAWEKDTKIWVHKFASLLRSHGVDTILDQWHVIPGDLLPEFMEKSVRESDFVLIICTPAYKRKSESEHPSGVVYEKGVITGELFVKRNQRKFIPVLQKGEWEDAAPSWVLGKTYVDLHGDANSENNYRDLLKTLYGKKEPPPLLGSPPDFIKPQKYRKKAIEPVPSSTSFSSKKTYLSQHNRNSKSIFVVISLVLVTIFGLSSLFAPSKNIPEIVITQTKEVTPKPTEIIEIVSSATYTASPLPSKTSQPTLTPTPTPLPTEITDNFGVKMELIPEGEFIIGSNEPNSFPLGTVFLESFYIDKYETTNSEYEFCVNDGVCQVPVRDNLTDCSFVRNPSCRVHDNYIGIVPDTVCWYTECSSSGTMYYGNNLYSEYPVANITFSMAKEYCSWRGAHLPTEQEWEKAARGIDGRKYPWGNTVINCELANYAFCVETTSAVGSYEKGKSIFNVYDMSGNVWEWIENEISDVYIARGGGFPYSGAFQTSYYQKTIPPDTEAYNIGFRCARDATP